MKKELRSEFFAWFKNLSADQVADLTGKMPIHNPEGHQLSDKNNAFLKFQNAEMNFTVVAGFQQWMAHGRCVKKGQKGFYIFFPSHTKAKTDDQGFEISPETDHFYMVPVFDVSQTFELSEPPAKTKKELTESLSVQEPELPFGEYMDPEDDRVVMELAFHPDEWPLEEVLEY